MTERVQCEICLEKYQKDELEEHREMCMARLIFQCAICEDYLSKEGLWNHLDQHEIAGDSKKLHCQEMRATHKLHQCALCNDQRGYQEKLYWKHVHDVHNGFFLRCSGCGESFRSQQIMTDHDVSQCKAKEQTEACDQGADRKFSKKLIPMQIENTASSVSCGEMHENVQLEPLQIELKNLLEEDCKCSEINNDDQQGTPIGPRLNVADCMDSYMTKMELPIASLTSRSEIKADEEKTSQKFAENLSDGSPDSKCFHCGKDFPGYVFLARHIELHHKPHTCEICGITFPTFFKLRYHKLMCHTEVKYKCPFCSKLFHRNKEHNKHVSICKNMKFKCEICHTKFINSQSVARHMKRFHKTRRASNKAHIDHIDCNEEQELYQTEKIIVRKEITSEETTSISEKLLLPLVQNTSSGSSSHIREVMRNMQIDHMSCKNQLEQKQTEQITLKMEITVEETKLLQHDDLGISKQNSSSTIDCSELSQYLKDQYIANPEPSSTYFSGQKSTLKQVRKSYILEEFACTSSKQSITGSSLNDHSSPNANGVDNMENYVTEKESEVMTEEKNLQPLVEKPSSALYGTKCVQCGKVFICVKTLFNHIESCHKPTTCNACGKLFLDRESARYRKRTQHTEPKHKCGNYPKNFLQKSYYKAHLTICNENKITCTLCGKKFKNLASMRKHFKRIHLIKEDLSKVLTDDCEKSTPNQLTITDCLDLRQHTEVQEIIDPELAIVNCSGQRSALTQERRTETHNEVDSPNAFTSSDRKKVDSRLIEHSPANSNDASDTNNLTEKKSKVHPTKSLKGNSKSKATAEKTLQPLVENLLSGPFDTKCTHCGKKCSSVVALALHIEQNHVPQACDICGLALPSYMKARYHKVRKHTEAKHQCPQCQKKFHYEQSYRTHLPHCGSKKFSCDFCDHKFIASESVVRHMKKFHKIKGPLKKASFDRIGCNLKPQQNQSLKNTIEKEISVKETTSNPFVTIDCPICSENCGDQNQVSRHVQEIHQMNMCACCGITFTSTDQLNDHKLTCRLHLKYVDYQTISDEISQPHGNTSVSELSDTVCPHCDKECCHEALLAQHITWCHQPVMCTTCGVTVSGKNQMKYHKLKYHSEPKFKCPHCSKICSNKVTYLRHVSTHLKESKFPCKLCGRKYKSSLAVKDHMRRKHSLKEYQTVRNDCNGLEQEPQPCDDVSSIKGENKELKTEIQKEKTTLQEQEYQAPDEDRGKSPTITIISASQLIVRKLSFPQHLKRKEEISKPHGGTSSSSLSGSVCPHCNKVCCHEASLAHHLAWCHQPVTCTTCGVTISGKHRMKYHKMKHHSEPKFKCPHCSKICSSKSNHLRHVSSHLKESKFPCKLCGLKFKNTYAVKDHMRQKHNLKEYQIDHNDSNELEQESQPRGDMNLLHGENMELKTEIQIEESTLQEQEYQASDEGR